MTKTAQPAAPTFFVCVSQKVIEENATREKATS
jgi:hypothetical protein